MARRSWRGRDAHVEIDAAVLELDRKRSRAAFVGSRRLSVLEIDDPIVQWAGNLAAVHDPVAQRTTFVWAAIFEREHLVARGAEDGNLAPWRFDRARASLRDGVQRTCIEPEVVGLLHGLVSHPTVSGCTLADWTSGGATGASTASGMNSCSSRPAARSAHGSFRAARCDFRKRSTSARRPS